MIFILLIKYIKMQITAMMVKYHHITHPYSNMFDLCAINTMHSARLLIDLCSRSSEAHWEGSDEGSVGLWVCAVTLQQWPYNSN